MRKSVLFVLAVLSFSLLGYTQETDNITNQYLNTADNLLVKDNKLVIGGYGEVHYNQPFDDEVYNNGTLDVHRIVMLFGYNFNERTKFVTELEFEHVKEVYVEQAFLQYKLNNYLNFRGGLMLIPMGIINEYHEPTAFNGVERPFIDKYIAPTTWREIGFGFTGNILPASLKYQVYIINGFNGYDGSSKLNGKNGLRKGRQKGAESYISSPNFTGKAEYYGIRGLNFGISGYLGKTQSTLYNGVAKNDKTSITIADSSVVGISMLGLDARYQLKGFQFKSQLYYSNLSNTEQYNQFTADNNGTLNDLGKSMLGYYFEVGYDVLRPVETSIQLIPFTRFEFMNTHNTVDNNAERNLKYAKTGITSGFTLKIAKGAVVKADIQLTKSGDESSYSKTLNMGVGVMF